MKSWDTGSLSLSVLNMDEPMFLDKCSSFYGQYILSHVTPPAANIARLDHLLFSVSDLKVSTDIGCAAFDSALKTIRNFIYYQKKHKFSCLLPTLLSNLFNC